MNFSAVYLIHRCFDRIRQFMAHWYIGGFIAVWNWVHAALTTLDETLAFRITLQNLFQPLYQDFTVIGYVLGFIFRVIRVAIGLLLYPVVVGGGAVAYLLWASIPLIIIYTGFAHRSIWPWPLPL